MKKRVASKSTIIFCIYCIFFILFTDIIPHNDYHDNNIEVLHDLETSPDFEAPYTK